ncbi:MAG TPA: hypothetical protein VGO47_12380, partial [Chlamydiales bacterium]|nr:hypothetical protein [Chlamydiales bacterium]
MSLRDETRTFILAVFASLLANALYEAYRSGYLRRIIGSVYLKAIETRDTALANALLLASLLVRAIQSTKGRVLIEAKSCFLLVGNWWSSVTDSFSTRRRRLRLTLSGQLSFISVSPIYPIPRLGVVFIAALAIATMLLLVVMKQYRERSSPSFASAEIAKQTKDHFGDLIGNNTSDNEVVVSLWLREND